MIKYAKNEQRELNVWCKLVLEFTKEMEENNSRAIRHILNTTLRNAWMLASFSKHQILASENAYNEFYKLTGKDIRDFDDDSSATTKSGDKFKVHAKFQFEHMTTVKDLRGEILSLYETNKLDEKSIKDLIVKQRVCWVTKEENKRLNQSGYTTHRQNPIDAYKKCGIKIYDEQHCDLSNVMKPTF